MRPDVKQYAEQVAAVRDRWLKIHEGMFAIPWWRALRRVIRIPGIFEAIPYRAQADELQLQLNELGNLDITLVAICGSEEADDEAKALAAATVLFVERLLPVVSILHDINRVMADNIERGATDYTLPEYNRDVARYEKAHLRFRAAIPEIGRQLAERETVTATELDEDLELLSNGLYFVAGTFVLGLERELSSRSHAFANHLTSPVGKSDAEHYLTVALVAAGIQSLRNVLRSRLFDRVLENVFAAGDVSAPSANEIEREVNSLRARWNDRGRADCNQLLDAVLQQERVAQITLGEFAVLVGKRTLESLQLRIESNEERLALLSAIAGAINLFYNNVDASIPHQARSNT